MSETENNMATARNLFAAFDCMTYRIYVAN